MNKQVKKPKKKEMNRTKDMILDFTNSESRYIPHVLKRDSCLKNDSVNTLFIYGDTSVRKSMIIREDILQIAESYPQDDIYIFASEKSDSYSFLQTEEYKHINHKIHIYSMVHLTDPAIHKELVNIDKKNPVWIFIDFDYTELLPEMKEKINIMISLSVPAHNIITIICNSYYSLAEWIRSMISNIQYLYYLQISDDDTNRLADFSTPAFLYLNPMECLNFFRKDTNVVIGICKQKIVHLNHKEIFTKVDFYSSVE